jgi:hypothetical protein
VEREFHDEREFHREFEGPGLHEEANIAEGLLAEAALEVEREFRDEREFRQEFERRETEGAESRERAESSREFGENIREAAESTRENWQEYVEHAAREAEMALNESQIELARETAEQLREAFPPISDRSYDIDDPHTTFTGETHSEERERAFRDKDWIKDKEVDLAKQWGLKRRIEWMERDEETGMPTAVAHVMGGEHIPAAAHALPASTLSTRLERVIHAIESNGDAYRNTLRQGLVSYGDILITLDKFSQEYPRLLNIAFASRAAEEASRTQLIQYSQRLDRQMHEFSGLLDELETEMSAIEHVHVENVPEDEKSAREATLEEINRIRHDTNVEFDEFQHTNAELVHIMEVRPLEQEDHDLGVKAHEQLIHAFKDFTRDYPRVFGDVERHVALTRELETNLGTPS